MEPGRLIAQGRDGEIFEYGTDLVLRRTRSGRTLESEARVMEYVRGAGYPVPVVHELRNGDTEMVMDRIAGPLMLDVILRRLWTLPRAASTLADLHDQLHAIPARQWMRSAGDGNQVLHLDLHPLNVIIHPERGPVVIDWSSASRGDALTDVGLTYVLLTCPRTPGPAPVRAIAAPIRAFLAHRFLRRYRGPALDGAIAFSARMKMLDAHMHPDEIEKMRRLVERRERGR